MYERRARHARTHRLLRAMPRGGPPDKEPHVNARGPRQAQRRNDLCDSERARERKQEVSRNVEKFDTEVRATMSSHLVRISKDAGHRTAGSHMIGNLRVVFEMGRNQTLGRAWTLPELAPL